MAVDKPAGWTSHDVVAHVRRVFGIKKVGHTGTLDPMATGVLVLCLGAFTRLSQYVTDADKRYHTVARLGIETDTLDADGQVVHQSDQIPQNLSDIDGVVLSFIGKIQQIPPMYSAIKVDGKRLYDLARRGETVEREPRSVEIYDLVINAFEFPDLTLDVHCSKGTYIRTLAADIGQKLGCGAHITVLRRTAIGQIDETKCVSVDTLKNLDGPEAILPYLLDQDLVLGGLARVVLTEDMKDRFLHGNVILFESELQLGECRVVDGHGNLLGIGRLDETHHLQPVRVISRREG